MEKIEDPVVSGLKVVEVHAPFVKGRTCHIDEMTESEKEYFMDICASPCDCHNNCDDCSYFR